MSETTPSDLAYTEQHEWIRDDGDVLTVGITHFAQDQLGDVVFVDLPDPGATLEQEQVFGEVESTKSVSDLYSPVGGEIVERNDALDEQPELVNTDPYGRGWLVTLRPSDRSQLDGLLDAEAYDAFVTG